MHTVGEVGVERPRFYFDEYARLGPCSGIDDIGVGSHAGGDVTSRVLEHERIHEELKPKQKERKRAWAGGFSRRTGRAHLLSAHRAGPAHLLSAQEEEPAHLLSAQEEEPAHLLSAQEGKSAHLLSAQEEEPAHLLSAQEGKSAHLLSAQEAVSAHLLSTQASGWSLGQMLLVQDVRYGFYPLVRTLGFVNSCTIGMSDGGRSGGPRNLPLVLSGSVGSWTLAMGALTSSDKELTDKRYCRFMDVSHGGIDQVAVDGSGCLAWQEELPEDQHLASLNPISEASRVRGLTGDDRGSVNVDGNRVLAKSEEKPGPAGFELTMGLGFGSLGSWQDRVSGLGDGDNDGDPTTGWTRSAIL
ncbi:hypothetical protein L1987_16823 [Smallanthus sonchifolius]|uniref:Uncharacterized protein n=1 Tax=Smallanthus sonchifolius TaxID=185202 RepID=A0ACB9IW99_9ASTR|nr:hypothetical protein L1987_16823 [Smallanthus sonchifolius]